MSIATRPDCLGPEVVDLLDGLNRQKPVWVELGLQTIHTGTAQFIRRGYPLHVYEQAVHALKNRGIPVITHIMDMEEYFELLGQCLCLLRPDITIHRLTGDGPKSLLIAPLWTGNKRIVLNSMQKYFKDHDIWQGKSYELKD